MQSSLCFNTFKTLRAILATSLLLFTVNPLQAKDITPSVSEQTAPHWSENQVVMLGASLISIGALMAAAGGGLALDAHKQLGTPRATSDLKARALSEGRTYIGVFASGLALGLIGTRIVFGGLYEE